MNEKKMQEKAEKIKKQEASKDSEKVELKEQIESLENQITELTEDLNRYKKDAEDLKSKATSYLNTASYYKNQAEETKKDFDRYKERNKNIETDAVTKANQSVAKKILPILDNFNHAMQSVSPEVMQGFIMIYSGLMDTLKELGVAEIVAKNEKLNPEIHNCIETIITDDESLDGIIEKVYQKGYWFAESKEVIRPANVSVYKFS